MVKGSVLVTGCDSGLGLALLCKTTAGQNVAASVIEGRNIDILSCRSDCHGGLCLLDKGATYVLDITRLDEVEGFREVLEDKLNNGDLPPLYSIVNNAGIWRFGLTTEAFKSRERRKVAVETWREVLDVNLIGTLQITLALGNLLKSNSNNFAPRIFFISSVLDSHSLPGQGAYVASKFAICGLHETLCHELDGNIIPIIVKPGALKNTKLFNRDLNVEEPVDVYSDGDEDIIKASYRLLLKTGGDCRVVAQTVLYGLEQKYPKYEYSNFVGAIPFKIADYVPRVAFVKLVKLVLQNLALLYFPVRRLFKLVWYKTWGKSRNAD
ncbi:short-chain dehydrogenase [Babesia ovis]|uniref:Short-chain dehydrogenase n=1 Tax=Babesia ovis TaxID=5869 RepID=A0A9W5TAC4_BABOV|nr:short-chain dehydrogenase [Babesia ovis]